MSLSKFRNWTDDDWAKANSINLRHICSLLNVDYSDLKAKYSDFEKLKDVIRGLI